MSKVQEEVDQNYEAFTKELPNIIRDHRGKYALMKAQKIVGYFSSPADARAAGESFITDGIYSIQHVTDVPVDLGYFNYAVPIHHIQS